MDRFRNECRQVGVLSAECRQMANLTLRREDLSFGESWRKLERLAAGEGDFGREGINEFERFVR
jgi:hypothetical protein